MVVQRALNWLLLLQHFAVVLLQLLELHLGVPACGINLLVFECLS